MYRKNPISVRFLEGRHNKTMSLLDGFEAGSVLDIGCDDGHFLSMLSARFPRAALVACDTERDAVAEARKAAPRAKFVIADFMETDFAGSDLIVMLEILEHSKDPKAMLAKAASHMNAGGRILISFPRPELLYWRLIWSLWSNTFGRRWHGQHSEMTEKDMLRMVGECGLEAEKRTRFFMGSISIMLLKKVS